MSVDLNQRQVDFTLALAQLILHAHDYLGLPVRFAEVTRTVEQQRANVEAGLSKTMNSRHLDKLAADLVIYKDGVAHTEGEVFRPLGVFWESLGGRWGGRFHDPAAWRAKHGRDFDPATDLGWDTDHFEFEKEAAS